MFAVGPSMWTATGASESDPFWSDVRLLMHGEGANNGTTFTDSSSYNHTLAAVSGAVTSTAQFKYGAASLLFNGTTDYITVSSSLAAFVNLFNGAFTVEAWIRPSTVSSVARSIFTATNTLTGGFGFANFSISSSGHLYYSVNAGTVGPSASLASAPGLISANTWYHVAVSRSGANMKVFINGVEVATTSSWSVNYGGTNHVGVGAQANGYTDGSTGRFAGNIDELRVTAAQRYTGNFTPPTAQFPDA